MRWRYAALRRMLNGREVRLLTKLKPCPFCGSEADVMEHTWEHYNSCSSDEKGWGAGCKSDDCWASLDPDHCYHKTEQEAVDYWNTRT
jgi:hypothetical protein